MFAFTMAMQEVFRPCGVDAINTAGTYGGTITRVAEGPIEAHELLTLGADPAKQVDVCGAGDVPLGFAHDPAIAGDTVGVELLTGGVTRLGIAAKAIAAGVRVYSAAGGRVTDAVVSGSYCIGVSLTAASALGEEIEILPQVLTANP